MVSSDFGNDDVRRQVSLGFSCAIAGAASVVTAAAPALVAAAFLKNVRRSINSLPYGQMRGLFSFPFPASEGNHASFPLARISGPLWAGRCGFSQGNPESAHFLDNRLVGRATARRSGEKAGPVRLD